MTQPITKKTYNQAILRLEKLLPLIDENTPDGSPLAQEFLETCNLVEAYEEMNYQIGLPTLLETIELRMSEMKLKQKDLAVILNTSASRISDYLSGKREITLNIAKALHQKLNIDSDIILQE